MSQIESIKHQFHALIDRAEDEVVLTHFYEVFASLIHGPDDLVADSLNEQQRVSLTQSYEESKHPERMIPNTDVWQKYKKWLTK